MLQIKFKLKKKENLSVTKHGQVVGKSEIPVLKIFGRKL